MHTGFFEEDNGNRSSMRLMSVIALVAAIAFGVLTVTGGNKTGDRTGIYITFGFLISAFAPKAVQKFAEQKIPPYVLGHPEVSMHKPLPGDYSRLSVPSTSEEMIRRMQERGR